jgi:hypothetical protein
MNMAMYANNNNSKKSEALEGLKRPRSMLEGYIANRNRKRNAMTSACR